VLPGRVAPDFADWGINNDAGPVNPVNCAQLCEQDFVQSVPGVGGLSVPQTAPAAHAVAAAYLARQQIPAQACLLDERDAREHRTIIERFASRIARTARFGRGQRRLDESPQLIIKYRFGHILFVTETLMRLVYGHPRFCEAIANSLFDLYSIASRSDVCGSAHNGIDVRKETFCTPAIP